MKNTRIWILGGIVVGLLIYLLRRPSASAPRPGAAAAAAGPGDWLNSLLGRGATRTAAGAPQNPNSAAALITAGTGLLTGLANLWPKSKTTNDGNLQALVDSGIGYADKNGDFVFYEDGPSPAADYSYKPFYGSEGGDWSSSPTPDYVGTPQNTAGIFAPQPDYSSSYYPVDGSSFNWGWN